MTCSAAPWKSVVDLERVAGDVSASAGLSRALPSRWARRPPRGGRPRRHRDRPLSATAQGAGVRSARSTAWTPRWRLPGAARASSESVAEAATVATDAGGRASPRPSRPPTPSSRSPTLRDHTAIETAQRSERIGGTAEHPFPDEATTKEVNAAIEAARRPASRPSASPRCSKLAEESCGRRFADLDADLEDDRDQPAVIVAGRRPSRTEISGHRPGDLATPPP